MTEASSKSRSDVEPGEQEPLPPHAVDAIRELAEVDSALKSLLGEWPVYLTHTEQDGSPAKDVLTRSGAMLLCLQKVAPVSERGTLPQGWRFNTADFSITPGSVMLMRDEAGKKWWFSLSEETQEEVSLYVSARGNTFDEAMSAVCKLAAELPGPTRPAER